MTDYFALLGEARRPWLDAEKLKEKYRRLSRASHPDAELNEAFRLLSDPKLRLHHLLMLEGADLAAGRSVPPAIADLFWQSGAVLRATDKCLQKNAQATSTLARALRKPESAKLEEELRALEERLRARYESELEEIRRTDSVWASLPNELSKLIERYDSVSYLSRLLERTAEKRFQLRLA